MAQPRSAAARLVTSRVVEIIKYVIDSDSSFTSARDVAKALGISEVVVSKWVTGIANITTAELVNFCNRFRANPMYLIMGHGDAMLTKPFATQDPHEAMVSRLHEVEFMLNKLKRDALNGRNKKPEQPVKKQLKQAPSGRKVA